MIRNELKFVLYVYTDRASASMDTTTQEQAIDKWSTVQLKMQYGETLVFPRLDPTSGEHQSAPAGLHASVSDDCDVTRNLSSPVDVHQSHASSSSTMATAATSSRGRVTLTFDFLTFR